ncbi:MAG TPA: hypothetical protein VMF64_05720 [Steroidobacteraceae bacterium]|nr:hypothetical protein [Steroidobacteraceae bacterium]
MIWLILMSAFAGLTVWYAARTMLRFHFASNPASDPSIHAGLKRQLPRFLGIAMPGLLALRTGWLALRADSGELWKLTALLTMVTLLVASYIWTRRGLAGTLGLRVLAVPESEEARNLTRWSAAPSVTRRVFYVLIVVDVAALGLFTSETFYSAGIPEQLGAAAILLLALGLITVAGSVLVYMANHYAIPILTLLGLWFCLCSIVNDNHLIRTTADSASHPLFWHHKVDTEPPSAPVRAYATDIDSYFDGWWQDLARQVAGTDPIPVVIVAAEGGGVRAAYWTASVLARLDDLTRNSPLPFSRHILAISAVSGGSVGATVFDATLADSAHTPPPGTGAAASTSRLDAVDGVLGHDLLSDTLGRALFPDLFQRFVPAPIFDDRAIALEKALERAWTAKYPHSSVQLSHALPSLWQRDAYRIPMLFLNSTVVETGRRAIDFPLTIPPGYTQPAAAPFADALLLGDYLGPGIPLSTAALLSARFTYVSPAGLLDTKLSDQPGRTGPRWRRVVDGGYFDNSGAVTAQELVRIAKAVEQRAHSGRNQRRMRIIVLHLPNAPLSDGKALDLSRWEFLSEIFAPVKALLGTREARGTQAVSYLRSDPEISQPLYSVQPYYADVKAPLGWVLSQAVRDGYRAQLICGTAQTGCVEPQLRRIAATVAGAGGVQP